jgi:hypothetical protein
VNEARAYLNAEQLAAVTPWSVDAIEKMVRRGVLKRGVHYFQPQGRGTKLIFKWAAICEFIEADNQNGDIAVVSARRSEGSVDVGGLAAALHGMLD